MAASIKCDERPFKGGSVQLHIGFGTNLGHPKLVSKSFHFFAGCLMYLSCICLVSDPPMFCPFLWCSLRLWCTNKRGSHSIKVSLSKAKIMLFCLFSFQFSVISKINISNQHANKKCHQGVLCPPQPKTGGSGGQHPLSQNRGAVLPQPKRKN